jgi:protease secretion system outer membrane protein
VQLDQAKANQFALLTRVSVAENQYASIVGMPPPKSAFQIAAVPRRFPLETADRYLEGGRSTNPVLVTARQNELIAESGAKRAKASLLPTLAATYTQTESSGRSSSFTGIAFLYPLQGQTVAQISSAGAQAERAKEQVRQVEQQITVDIERLHALVDSGQQEWVIRKDAIASAELAVQANLKSQQGGIRTSVEVLNSIQTLANVRNDYANTAATLAENYLSLLLQSAHDPTDAMQRVHTAVFER